MQERLGKETKKMEVAERRRKLDLEGYGADLANMRKKIVFYEKYINKLRRLVEEDNAEIMNVMEDEEASEEEENKN